MVPCPPPVRIAVTHDRASVAALQHDFAGYCVQFVSGFFPGTTYRRGLCDQPALGDEPSLLDLIPDLTVFLPPGSQSIVSEFLVKRGPEAWKLALVGWAGTLLAGSQVMRLLMEGIHRIYGDKEKPGFSAPATSGIGAAAGDNRTAVGSGDLGSPWKAATALACGRARALTIRCKDGGRFSFPQQR